MPACFDAEGQSPVPDGRSPAGPYAAAPMARRRLAYLALAAASFLFGATFVLVKEAVTEMAPIGFVGWRFLLGL